MQSTEVNRFKLVPRAGVEPARPFGQRILSPQRLPFRHPGMFVRTRIVPRLLFLFEADPAVTSEYVVASVFAQFRLIPPGPFPGAT